MCMCIASTHAHAFFTRVCLPLCARTHTFISLGLVTRWNYFASWCEYTRLPLGGRQGDVAENGVTESRRWRSLAGLCCAAIWCYGAAADDEARTFLATTRESVVNGMRHTDRVFQRNITEVLWVFCSCFKRGYSDTALVFHWSTNFKI